MLCIYAQSHHSEHLFHIGKIFWIFYILAINLLHIKQALLFSGSAKELFLLIFVICGRHLPCVYMEVLLFSEDISISTLCCLFGLCVYWEGVGMGVDVGVEMGVVWNFKCVGVFLMGIMLEAVWITDLIIGEGVNDFLNVELIWCRGWRTHHTQWWRFLFSLAWR